MTGRSQPHRPTHTRDMRHERTSRRSESTGSSNGWRLLVYGVHTEVVKLILDTMVWSRIGRSRSREALEQCALARGWQICTPPSTLLEIFRDSNAERRNANIQPLLSRHWIRLRTEADMESMEIVVEARRVRPNWARQIPLTGRAASLRNFWTHQLWRETARRPEHVATFEAPGSERRKQEETALIDAMRWNHDQLPKRGQPPKVGGSTVSPADETPLDALYGGWNGPTDRWRVAGRDAMRYELRNRHFVDRPDIDTTVADWLNIYLHLSAVAKDWDDFGRFWLLDVRADRMPRQWMRWAIQFSQTIGSVGDSDGRDNQLATYLYDADVFITEDRRFVNALERVKPAAPVPFAEVKKIRVDPADAPVVEVIEAALS